MIYYNLNTINDWNFGDDNIIKVYKRGAVCYYKITNGDTPTPVQEPCFAVVDDITQYSDTEFEDVYDKATEKWFKLNNLNQYEEYGIYGSGRTSCEGSTSRLPQGYTEVEYIENTSTAYINTEVLLYDSTTNSYNIQCKCYFQPYGNDFEYLFGTEQTSSPYVGVIFRYYQRNIQYADNPDNVSWTHIDNGDGTSGITASCSSTTATNGNNPLTLFCGLWSTGPWRNGRGKIYSFKVTKNDTLVRDLVPCKRDSDDKYGMYDLITDTFYLSPNNVDFSGGEPITPTDCVTTYEGKLTIDDGDDGEDYSTHYLTLVAQTDNVTFSYSTATSSNKLQYSVDSGSTWNDLSNGSSTSSINNGDKIMFKASGLTVNTERGIGKIIPSASASVEGNIMSLEYGDNFSGQTTIQNNYQFRKLFSGVTTITSAENMVLPATTVKQQCYSQMFDGCTNLVKTPKTIGSSAMTWSGNYCFSNLFSYCTSLTTVPSGLLPALNLGTQCYWYMFEGCSGLTTAPDLPATTTASQCYQGMFKNCSSLNYITVLTTNNFTMSEWLSGVAASGTFVKNPNATWSSCGQNAYPCGWTVQDYVEPTPIKYEYQYSGGSWVNVGEVTGTTASLPDVPFTVNYNAKQYNASTKTLLKTEGQLANVDAVITAGTPTVHDGYLTIASSTRATISGYQNYFNRSDSTPNLTIISKQRTDGNNGHMFTNRDSNYNWMYRCYSNKLTLHGRSEQGSVAVTTQPVIESVRVNSSRLATYNNYTNNTSSTYSNFSYGGTNSGKFALFAGYASTTGEWFVGDFYWVYMCQSTLTDEQVQQVIDYNEGGGGEPEYPKYYDEIQDPPDNLVFSSMAEAEAYECPWVGMHATIDGDKYVFSGDSVSGYEWVYNPSRLPVGYTEVEYIQNTGTSYLNTNFVPNQDTRVVCDMQLVTASNFPRLWGAGAWNSATGIQPNYEGGHLNMSWLGKTSWTSYTSVPTSFDRKVYDVNKNYLYVDSVQIGSNTYTTRTASDPIGVFTYIGSGRPSSSSYWGQEHFKGKMYSFQIYDNGTLVRDLVPCIRDNDNTVGAYDIVNDVFYTVPTGYTTDKLIAGNPV